MKSKFILFLLLFTLVVIQTYAQSPTGSGIDINTTFSIPAGQAPAFLNDATDYKFAIVSSDGLTLINAQIFNYNNTLGNVLSIPPATLSYNTSYKWGVWSTISDPTAGPPNGIGYYLFTTGTPIISAAAVSFGPVNIGSTLAHNIVINNTGTLDLSITSITLPSGFTFTLGAPTYPIVIHSGGNSTLSITFTPLIQKSYNGTISILSNDPVTPTASVAVGGSGLLLLPTLNTPANNSFNVVPGTNVVWTSVPGTSVKYGVQISTDPTFTDGSQTLNFAEPVSSTTFTPTLIRYSYNIDYYWRVRSEQDTTGGGSYAYSPWTIAPFKFTTELPPITLSSPIGPVVFSTPTHFNWTVPAGSKISNIKFVVQVSKSNFGAVVYSDSVVAATTLNIPIVLAGPYFWKVTASAASQTSTFSTVSPFTLTLLPPPLIVPINGLSGVSILPTFRWHPVPGALSYKLYIFNGDPSVGSPTIIDSITVGTDTSKTFTPFITNFPLNNGTEYWWKVAALDYTKFEYPSSVFHFTTYNSTDVSLAAPGDGDIVYLSPVMLSWYINTSTSGLTFIVQYIDTTAVPTSEHFWDHATTISTTSLNRTISVLLGKTYYWRVLLRKTSPGSAPFDYIYYPSYSVYFTFTTAGGSSVTVYPSYPTGGTTVYNNTPTLYWYLDQYSVGLKFQIALSKTPDGNSNGLITDNPDVHYYPSADSSLGTTNIYYTFASALTPGTHYYWQVRAYYSGGGGATSSWSSIADFITNGPGTPSIPIPSYPIGGVPVYDNHVTLYWYLTDGNIGLRFNIEYAETISDLTGHVGTYHFIPTSVTDQLYLNLTLTPGHTYFWRVQSFNAANPAQTSGWSSLPVDAPSFTVVGGTNLSYPVATWPIGGNTIYTSRPTLNWYLEGSTLGISGYTVKWIRSNSVPTAPAWLAVTTPTNTAAAGSQSVSGVFNTSFLLSTDLTYGAKYFWYVDDGNPGLAAVDSFRVVGGNSVSVVLSQPDDSSTVYSTTVYFSWYINGPSTGITNYTLTYSQSDVFAPGVTFHQTTTSQYVNVAGLINGATYHWYVTANYPGGVTVTSDTSSFTIINGASPLIQPKVGNPNNVSISTLSPTLSWILPGKTAANTSYEVQLADNPNFSSPIIMNSNKPSLQTTGLTVNKGYFWKVRSNDGAGNTSYYSGTGKFKIINATTGVQNNGTIPTQFNLEQNYPNPFNPTTIINYSLPNNSFVVLKIYDMLGREIKTLVSNEKSAGNYSITWKGQDNNGNKVTSGIYIYRISAGNYSSARKMVVLK